eukprot:TRINITY_DN69619_c0_g1_i1.p1 TRINITY_DN69619_c0_g1~~TRINITY_DN69619_c0_g1_i1.p1  ORF type:complete len:786 (+),score=169.47 TRINITY_DN69619_c0_g1_i1:54-2411(+)
MLEGTCISNALESRANKDSWTFSVYCSRLEEATAAEVADAACQTLDLEVESSLRHVALRRSDPSELLERYGGSIIRSSTEWRSKLSEGQRVMLLLYHAFALLEVDDGIAICTEKYNDKLELMFGQVGLVAPFAVRYRATGDERKPAFPQARRELEQLVTVADLVSWICGPIAVVWRPYCLLQSNCQHYVRDLGRFLTDCSLADALRGDREVVHSSVRCEGQRLRLAAAELRKDFAVVHAAVEQDGLALQFAAVPLRDEFDIVLTAVKQNGLALQFAGAHMRASVDIAFAAVEQTAAALEFVSEELRRNRSLVLLAAGQRAGEQDGNPDWSRVFCSPAICADVNVALTALREDVAAIGLLAQSLIQNAIFMRQAVAANGLVLGCAAEGIRSCFEDVNAAVRQNGLALKYAAVDLRDNHEIVLTAIMENGGSMLYVSDRLKRNRGLVATAARRWLAVDWDFLFAKDGLRDDAAVVASAVGQDWRALEFVAERFKQDKALLCAACEQSGFALEFAANCLRIDSEVAMAAVSRHGLALQFAGEEMRDAEAVVMTAVKQDAAALQFASPRLKRHCAVVAAAAKGWFRPDWLGLLSVASLSDDRDVILGIVSCDWRALGQVAEVFRGDVEIVEAALAQDVGCLQLASVELLAERESLLRLLLRRGAALQFAAESCRDDRDVVLAAVSQDGAALRFASERLKQDKALVLQALQCSSAALEFAADSLQADKEVVLAAVQQDGAAIRFASDTVKSDSDVLRSALRRSGSSVLKVALQGRRGLLGLVLGNSSGHG